MRGVFQQSGWSLLSFLLIIGIAFPGSGESETDPLRYFPETHTYGLRMDSYRTKDMDTPSASFSQRLTLYPYQVEDRQIVTYGPDENDTNYRMDSYRLIPGYTLCQERIRTYRDRRSGQQQIRLCDRDSNW
ncbi:MAG: hypothetical protein IPP74_07760 [Alphaproteobacteria bacterium]|nr:hypothetical protein [Alphaproteobacteria bacterium]